MLGCWLISIDSVLVLAGILKEDVIVSFGYQVVGERKIKEWQSESLLSEEKEVGLKSKKRGKPAFNKFHSLYFPLDRQTRKKRAVTDARRVLVELPAGGPVGPHKGLPKFQLRLLAVVTYDFCAATLCEGWGIRDSLWG